MATMVYPNPNRELPVNLNLVPDSLSSSSIHLHHRNPSNPFEVIYDERPSHTRTNSQLWHNSHNYQEISNNIHYRSPSAAIPDSSAMNTPILTILEPPTNNNNNTTTTISTTTSTATVSNSPATGVVSVSGSIVSRLATLRHRKNIIRRNKTVKRKDIKEKKPLKFPIRRKSSLKYRSINNNNSNSHGIKSKFSTKKQMLEYMKNVDYYELVHNLIPASFKLYKHKKILRPRPKLTYESFGMPEQESPEVINPKKYDMYDKYRELIFEGKYQVEELDEVVLSDEKLNRRLLFEILLRRTVAAKMEYRLKAAFEKSMVEGDAYMLEPIRRSTETMSMSSF